MNERFIEPLPAAELERRWALAAEVMQQAGCDALVVQNSNDWLGGYVRWLTGAPATNAYPRSAAFFGPRDITIVEQGPRGSVEQVISDAPGLFGIQEFRYTPSYTSALATASDDADLIADVLRERGAKRVGWINPAGAYFGFGSALKRRVGADNLVDVTPQFDILKALKSDYEIGLIRKTATLQDEVMAAVRGFIRPDLHDFEVAAFAEYKASTLGAEQGIYLSSSSPAGKAAVFRPRHMRGRKIGKGDTFVLLVETNGPGGYYTEIGRTFSLGTPDSDLVRATQAVIDAQRFTLEHLVPGAHVSEIHAAHNIYMAERNLPLEHRLYCHGQGYDMVERPLIRDDDDMVIAAGMSIVCHPGIITDQVNGLVCDNYLIHATGLPESIHRTPQDIMII